MLTTMETLSAILALVAGIGALAVLVATMLGERSPATLGIARWVLQQRAAFTFAVALLSTLGSLYFSEIADFVPCRLCWFQRVFMYPITIVALVGLVRRDAAARWYSASLAVIGGGVSLYHLLIERGILPDSTSCSLFGPPCSEVWFRAFGFVTLAFMALCGFVAIVVLNLLPVPGAPSPEETP